MSRGGASCVGAPSRTRRLKTATEPACVASAQVHVVFCTRRRLALLGLPLCRLLCFLRALVVAATAPGPPTGPGCAGACVQPLHAPPVLPQLPARNPVPPFFLVLHARRSASNAARALSSSSTSLAVSGAKNQQSHPLVIALISVGVHSERLFPIRFLHVLVAGTGLEAEDRPVVLEFRSRGRHGCL